MGTEDSDLLPPRCSLFPHLPRETRARARARPCGIHLPATDGTAVTTNREQCSVSVKARQNEQITRRPTRHPCTFAATAR